MSVDNLGVIKDKLRQFKRKYYVNKIIRGSVVLGLICSSMFVAFALSEGVFWLSSEYRKLLIGSLILSAAGVFAAMIAFPTLRLLNIGKTMSDDEAAGIIGKFFNDVDDKLLNLLQMARMGEKNDLLIAAIQYRIDQMRPIPFPNAINFKPNYRLARWLAIPALIAALAFVINPEVITKGSYRLMNYNEHFSPPPPFSVQIPDHRAKLVDGESHTIHIKVDGKELPSELFIFIKDKNDVNFQKYTLNKTNNSEYSFVFKNVHLDFDYYIGNDLYGAPPYSVTVLQRPSMNNFFVVLNYPSYTRMEPETLANNVGDFTALNGTIATWYFTFKGPVASAGFHSHQTTPNLTAINLQDNDQGKANFTKVVTQSIDYSIFLKSNAEVPNVDTVRYAINVVQDKYPNVTIQSPTYDSALPASGIATLTAEVSDDFGFSRAEFAFRFIKSNTPSKVSDKYKTIPLSGLPGANVGVITQALDFMNLGVETGDEVEYYVRVWDNDYVTGPKAATSAVQKIIYQSIQSQYDDVNKEAEEFSADLSETLAQSEQLAKDIESIEKKIYEKKNMSYEDKKQMSEAIKSQQEMLQKLEEAKEQLEKQVDKAQENNLYTPETVKKLEQLEKMLDKMMTPEMKKYLEELQKKVAEMDKQQMKMQMEQFKENAETFKQDIERAIELFKQLKVDQKVQEVMQKLDNLEKRQDMLNDKLQEAKTKEDIAAIEEKQKELNNEMKNLDKDLQDLQDLKNDTKDPDKETMDKLDKLSDEAQSEMQDAAQQMQKNNPKQAGKSQKQSQQKMQQMQQMLNDMQAQNEMEQQQENYEDLRNLLENLIKLSFDQEALRDQMAKLKMNDPSVKNTIQKQSKIKDDMAMIEDSLIALSKRAFEIEKFITDELKTINSGIRRSLEHINDKQIGLANREQHQIMTGLNNLANMLTESLNKMQQQMKMMMNAQGKGSKMCKMPSAGQPSMQELSKMQQQLNQKLQQMMQQKGGEKESPEGNPDKYGEAAAQQEAIRQKLKDLFDKISKDGEKGLGSGDKIMQEMKESEEELRNKQLSIETLRRQQQILNRMLDYDKSMREREYDNNRKSTTGKDRKVQSPAELTEEQVKNKIRKENFNKDKFQYTPTYQNLIEEYYRLLDNKK